MDQDAKPETSARPTGKHRPPWLTSLLLVLLPLVALIALLWGGGAWLTGTPSGLRALLTMAGWAVPSLSVSGVEGSVSNGFTIDRLVIDEPRWSLHATELALTPQEISVRRRLIDLGRLHARNVEVRWTSEPSKAPAQPPQSLALPFNLNLRDVRIAQLALGARGAEPTTLNDVALQLSADRNAIRVAHASARFGPTTIRASGHIDAASPFALEAHADLQTTVLEKPVQASIDAGGQLANIALSATSDNDAARLSARAQATPFAAVPLAGLSLNIAQLELSQWLPQVPPMRLSGSADLQPRTIDNALALAGPFSVSNALAGPVDRQRIPLQSLRGTLTWSASLLNVAIDRAELAGGAASGTLTRRSDGRIQAQLRFNGIDATRIHTAAVKTQIAGALDYALADGVQSFQGKATNARGLDLGAEFALKLANSVLDVERAHLRIGDGRADVSGRVTLGQAPAAQLRGQFAALDLSQFFKGFDTRLNGRLTVDGTLGEPRRGHAEIELADSRIAGRALQGNADIKVNGDLLDVATDVRSGAAHLTAQGGLGKGRELTFELNAPNLGELASTLAGSVQAQGTVSGSLQQPSIVASATASNLTLPSNQHIDRAEAHVRASAAADAKLDVELTVNGHRVPDKPAMSLTKASLTTRGTTSAHTIALDATTAMEQPVRLRAAGGWNGKAWQGRINEAVVGKPLDLHLDRPAPVTLSPERVALGPTAFTARETHFTDVDFERVDGHWQSSGVFTELQPQALDPRARAPRRAVRTTAANPQPLTLAGRWSLTYGDALNGILVVERTSGDLYSGIDAVHPIGISDIGAALNIVNNRVTGTAYLRGRALGKVDVGVDAWVDPDAFQLAQNRRLRVTVDASLPDLGWMGPLIGDAVQIEGSAAVNAVISGTPSDPTADGKVTGRNLRLVWIEQGLRLENGTLDAALEDGVLVLNEMVFTGDARVAPGDKRALAALTSGETGSVRVVGRIALQTLTGSIGVRAKQLPILQRADRWMVISGEGGITLTPSAAELYAKAVVDGAYIDFSSLRGPRTLPGDVVVVRANQPARGKDSAPPLDVTLNVEARLGQRFYIRGAGLEARLAGALTVTGRPSQLTAIGNVRIVDGIYNGYGQRLQIQRGMLTFSGPLENPALNVLAVRQGLPVEVGVQISGTALSPTVRLYSDVAMPDVEKLNWLVLGRPAGGGESQDRALLSAAASALFAGQSDKSSSNILRSFGLDEFGLRSGGQGPSSLLPRETVAGTLRSSGSGAGAGDFVTLGKRLSDELYLTFEEALNGAEFYVALNYQLTRRLSVIARAGSTNALDLVYTITFD